MKIKRSKEIKITIKEQHHSLTIFIVKEQYENWRMRGIVINSKKMRNFKIQ